MVTYCVCRRLFPRLLQLRLQRRNQGISLIQAGKQENRREARPSPGHGLEAQRRLLPLTWTVTVRVLMKHATADRKESNVRSAL